MGEPIPWCMKPDNTIPFLKSKKPIKRYDNPNRDSPSVRGYDRKWAKLRKYYLNRHPLCAKCKMPGNQVDHIVPFQKGVNKTEKERLRLSESNLQTLCVSCHARKTRREQSK